MNITMVLFVLVSVSLLALVALGVLVFNLKNEIYQLKKFNAKLYSRLTGVVQDQQTMNNATFEIGQRINYITTQMQNLDARQDELDLKEQADKPIQQAIALAEKGATIDELMDNCALSRGEAELLLRLHGESLSDEI